MRLLFLCAFLAILFGVQHSADIPDAKAWCPNCNGELPPSDSITSLLTLGNQLLRGGNDTCGDKICNPSLSETCATCPEDCGECIFNKPILSCINKNQVTLTFDDGPTSYMFQILESLKKLNINATFFINGLNVMQNVSLPANALNSTNWTNSTMADLIRRAYNEGHVIGTHTYSHIGLVNGTTGYNLPSELGYVPLNMLQMQLLVNDLVIYDIIKKYPQVFRPPYFEINQTVLHVVESMGYIPIAANVDSVDYAAKSVQDILGNITQGVVRNRNESGIIVLQHDGHNLTAFNLEPVVTYLRNANLSIVDLPTCLNMSSDTLYRSSSLFNKSSNYPTFNQTGLFFNVSSILQVTSTSLVDTTSTDSSTTTPTEITSISTTPTPTTSPITTTSSSTTTQSTKQSQTIRSHVAPRFDLKYGVLQLALILILMFFIL